MRVLGGVQLQQTVALRNLLRREQPIAEDRVALHALLRPVGGRPERPWRRPRGRRRRTLIDGLEGKELVERVRGESDRRVQLVSITDAGRKVVDAA